MKTLIRRTAAVIMLLALAVTSGVAQAPTCCKAGAKCCNGGACCRNHHK